MTSTPDVEEISALMVASFHQLTGRSLVETPADSGWLYQSAPFALLAHDRSEDPRFVYANRTAQACFGYAWEEFIGMPSRLSAEAPDREERQRLLDAVSARGFIDNYRGVRIAKSGRRFWIEEATVWQLVRSDGVRVGQAAVFHTWKDL
ncbi:MEKHLA domain-containing protein [Ensifer adhaerens]|jgi:PAS domain S-box-containing protein|uniref:MEKHLA domain-containing protein n=1 Tax=Ensifer TaxID=106591 RepID=UPI001A54269F|nr:MULTISPECIES: MEKHLA domain-containing protein [Ensifer]MBK5568356.1 MEKHLA domain-containing protein [Ensifer sp. SSB1]MBZ7926048.1 MEKHLA domain-containing protein [Ensifer adhaerens]UAX94805.1 MEKHLA domain-containing protein [Ensifer adhaerens]UAY03305.1 MEKHLA domain-containing protein [Ensifer adhaerens]UAY11290.1 MEKHLA domain-containing protein [Ensifer adhaerens]